ncbi:unnamed protein product [Caenorhabditis sp. 36 PRJEB53466]|nr:unnamed protein product [Caenorhabditis sp. 36 PRJEB53466]
MTFDDGTCVAGNWYFNNELMKAQSYSNCEPPRRLDYTNITSPTSICSCPRFEYVSPDLSWTVGRYYDQTYAWWHKYTYTRGAVKFDSSTCTLSMSCAVATDALIVFGTNIAPIVYPQGYVPYTTCKTTPLATNSYSMKYWFADGVMLSYPAFGCIQACVCSYVKLFNDNLERLVSNTSFYPYAISSYPFEAPTDNRANFTSCLTRITCPTGHTLVNFDTLAQTVIPSGSLNAVCNKSTKKWTISGNPDVTAFDRLWVLCVDFRV